MKEKKIFIVSYSFQGNGSVNIEAKDKREARKKFFEGEFSDEKEQGDDYTIDEIKKSL